MIATAKADLENVLKTRQEKKAKRMIVNRYAAGSGRRLAEAGWSSGWLGPCRVGELGAMKQRVHTDDALRVLRGAQKAELGAPKCCLSLRFERSVWQGAFSSGCLSAPQLHPRGRLALPTAFVRILELTLLLPLRPASARPRSSVLHWRRSARSRRRCSCSATRALPRMARRFGTRSASSPTSRRKQTRARTPRACARCSCSSSTAKQRGSGPGPGADVSAAQTGCGLADVPQAQAAALPRSPAATCGAARTASSRAVAFTLPHATSGTTLGGNGSPLCGAQVALSICAQCK